MDCVGGWAARGLIGTSVAMLAGCYAGIDASGDDETEATAAATGNESGPTDGPSDATAGPGDTTAGNATDGPGPTDSTMTDPSGDPDGGSTDDGPEPSDVEVMCERWNSDRVDMSEGDWSGSVAACDPGDISATGRDNALRILNLYRFMVGLPEVATDPSRDAMAQSCALMMHANGALSHDPPMDWQCYSADGADAAGSSNISSGPGVLSVDLYMVDPGNSTTLGHRRWILSNSVGPVGLGSTSERSCMWVIGGSGGGDNEWTAWPPPGPFPIGAVDPLGFSSLDETGWSVQSDSIELGSAEVTITVDGDPRPVQVTTLAPGFGSSSAISMIPMGWTTQANTTYHVEVGGVSTPLSYDVHVVDCG